MDKVEMVIYLILWIVLAVIIIYGIWNSRCCTTECGKRLRISIKPCKIDFIFIAFLFLLTCIFFWKILLHPNQMIYGKDIVSLGYPGYFFADNMLKNGTLPFWEPYASSGNPFILNAVTFIFYPINLIMFSIFPVYLGFGYNFILHTFLAGLFMYIFMRYIQLDKMSSFLSSIIFMFSGYAIPHIYAGHDVFIAAGCWVPLIFLLFMIALNKRSLFYGLLTGIPIGIQLLVGHIQIPYYTIFALGLYLLFRCFLIVRENRDYKTVFKLFYIFALALVVGILLSAIYLIPAFELSKYITRAGGVNYDFATSYSFPLQNFITFILPNFFGNPDINYWGQPNYWELSSYIGILPLFLVFIAIYFKRDKKHVLFFTGLAFLSLLFALGRNTPVYWLLWKFLPGLSMLRCPARFLFLFTFSASILSGFGFSFLREKLTLPDREKVWKFVKILTVLILLLLCVTILTHIARDQIIQFGQKMLKQRYYAHGLDYIHTHAIEYYFLKINLIYSTIIGGLLSLLVLSLGSVSILALRIKEKIPIRCFNIIVILFILFNLWFYYIGFINTKDPKEIYSEPDYVAFLKINSAGYRVYNIDNKIQPNFQIIYGIHTVGGYNPYPLSRYNQLLDCIRNLEDKNHPILNLLNVKYILTSTRLKGSGYKLVYNKNNIYIYENEQALPKAFVIHNLKTISEKNVIKELKNNNFNPVDAVILEEKSKSGVLSNRGFDEVEVKKYSPNEIILETNVAQPGFLVLSEIYYPDWKVYVDGKQRKIYRAYHALRSVYLDEGQHTVRFVYSSLSFRIGSWITFLTLILLVLTISIKIITYLKSLKIK